MRFFLNTPQPATHWQPQTKHNETLHWLDTFPAQTMPNHNTNPENNVMQNSRSASEDIHTQHYTTLGKPVPDHVKRATACFQAD